MNSLISTLISRPEAPGTEKFNAILNIFSIGSIRSLIQAKFEESGSESSVWVARAYSLLEAILAVIENKRKTGSVSTDGILALGDLSILEEAINEISDDAVRNVGLFYLNSIPGFQNKLASAKEQHGFVFMYMTYAMRSILNDLEDAKAAEKTLRPARPGDIVAEGPGFDVVMNKLLTNHVRYLDGNTSVIVMHDIREGHFLLVERYNPIRGVYTLEFPRSKNSTMQTRETMLNTDLKEQTGLSFRDLEKIGTLTPESHILEGSCDVYYGNFDLEENHVPTCKMVRSLKRITEEGLYQAAYDGRVECGITLGAIAIWHAYEAVRKKRVANSRRVRVPKATEEDEDD